MSTQSSDQYSLLTPGAMLRAAREAKEITQAQVAEKLHLSLQKIKDIEEDNYDHVVAWIYVRGYLRSYAKLVEVAEDKVMKSFADLGVGNKTERQESAIRNAKLPVYYSRSGRKQRRWLRWMSMGIALLLIILVVTWWREQNQQAHSSAADVTALNSANQPLKMQDLQLTDQAKKMSTAVKSNQAVSSSAATQAVSHRHHSAHHREAKLTHKAKWPAPSYKLESVK